MSRALEYENAFYEQLSSANATDVKSGTVPTWARAVCLNAQSQDVYVSFDGSDPSSSHGHRIIAGAQPVVLPFLLASGGSFKAVSQTASTAKLDVTYLR